jgi:hypothetical protein
MQEPIARRELVGVSADGARFALVLAIGRPYISGSSPETWSCAVSLDPLYPRLPDQVGTDSFQALVLATNTALDLLLSFKADGGRVLFPDGSEYPIEALTVLVSRASPNDEN